MGKGHESRSFRPRLRTLGSASPAHRARASLNTQWACTEPAARADDAPWAIFLVRRSSCDTQGVTGQSQGFANGDDGLVRSSESGVPAYTTEVPDCRNRVPFLRAAMSDGRGGVHGGTLHVAL